MSAINLTQPLKNEDHAKKEYWQEQIKKWEASKLSQSAFCRQSGINISTFSYWKIFLSSGNKKLPHSDKAVKEKSINFAPISISQPMIQTPVQTIQIKLLTGHTVYLPTQLGADQIAAIIRLLGMSSHV